MAEHPEGGPGGGAEEASRPEGRGGSGKTDVPGPLPPAGERGRLDRALDLVRYLRRHDPWDARQTHGSLVPHLLEEAHEVVDAIRAGDEEALEAELGDLLLNLAFQVVVGEEEGTFDAGSVAGRLEEKIARRHPHLFGRGEPVGWEEAKAREREVAGGASPGSASSPAAGPRSGLLDGVGRDRDPLIRAFRLQERAAEVGFDWPDATGPLAKVAEEADEVRALLEDGRHAGAAPSEALREALEEEVGDLLFAVVNLARLLGVRPDAALGRANGKFVRRVSRLEERALERGVVLGRASLEELDRIWEEVKREE